jgi:hypothetical protein
MTSNMFSPLSRWPTSTRLTHGTSAYSAVGSQVSNDPYLEVTFGWP